MPAKLSWASHCLSNISSLQEIPFFFPSESAVQLAVVQFPAQYAEST